jgi:hypothetical protein
VSFSLSARSARCAVRFAVRSGKTATSKLCRLIDDFSGF